MQMRKYKRNRADQVASDAQRAAELGMMEVGVVWQMKPRIGHGEEDRIEKR